MVAAGAALILYVAFAAFSFGWRSWQQARRTGDSGIRGFRGGPLARIASGLFLLGLAAAPLGPLAVLLGRLETFAPLRHPVVPATGLIVVAAGLVVAVVGQASMGASWRIGVDPSETTDLVTGGAFAYVRNPTFTGILVLLAGMVLMVPTWLAVAAFVCTWLGLELQVRFIEEPYLLAVHGERYRAYARRTGRFLPRMWRVT